MIIASLASCRRTLWFQQETCKWSSIVGHYWSDLMYRTCCVLGSYFKCCLNLSHSSLEAIILLSPSNQHSIYWNISKKDSCCPWFSSHLARVKEHRCRTGVHREGLLGGQTASFIKWGRTAMPTFSLMDATTHELQVQWQRSTGEDKYGNSKSSYKGFFCVKNYVVKWLFVTYC